MAEEAERGDVVLGGCMLDVTSPGLHCLFCACEWSDALPAWWPPEDARSMDPAERARARDDLVDRFERARVVADAFEHSGVGAATEAAGAFLRHAARHGPGAPVVPSDCVLLAGALDAAEKLCRALTVGDDPDTWGEFVLLGPEDVHAMFSRAHDQFESRGFVDVLRPEDDWLTALALSIVFGDAEGPAALARAGQGSELPRVGPAWHRQLDRLAAEECGDGSGHGWVRYLWSRLTLPPLLTDLDTARAGVRVVALGALRRAFFDRSTGVPPRDPWAGVENPGIPALSLGYLAATEEVAPDGTVSADRDSHDVENRVLRELAGRECRRIGPEIVDAIGVPDVVAHTWASQFGCVRYPLSPEARAAAEDRDLTSEERAAVEWVADGMPL